MQWIKAWVQSQGFVHDSVSWYGLHQVETTEPNGTILQDLGTKLFAIVDEILGTQGIVGLGSADLQGGVRDLGAFFLSLSDVDTMIRRILV